MRASGKAITANAFIVALGFLALLMADLFPLQVMGVLIAQTLLFSGFTTLMLLPAAASFFQPGFVPGGPFGHHPPGAGERRLMTGLSPAGSPPGTPAWRPTRPLGGAWLPGGGPALFPPRQVTTAIAPCPPWRFMTI